VYARQKGADDGMIERLEESINHLAGLVAQQLGIDHRSLPGAGAAGGLGYGLATFCRAQIRPGFALVSESLNLEDRVAASDLVITGEGRLDAQTLYGKAPAEVARLAKRSGKPVAVVCGQCELAGNASELFDLVIPLSDLEPSLERCFKNTGPLLVEAGRRIAEWVRRG